MSQIVKGIQAKLVAAAASLLILHPAFAFETHVQPPQIRAPTPQLRVPNIHTPTPNVVVPGRSNSDATCPNGGCDDARGKRPADKRNPADKNGEPASAIAKYRLAPLPDTSVSDIFRAIANGADDSAYAAAFAAYQAAIVAAEQAVTVAAQCKLNPSLPGCASAESVPQAQQNLIDAQNALTNFYSDMQYLLWLLTFVETVETAPPTSGDSEAEMTVVEEAIQECLASPSTCEATIAQLNAVLAELGVPATITLKGITIGVLYTPAEIASEFAGNGYPPPNPSQDSLSYAMWFYARDWFLSWYGPL